MALVVCVFHGACACTAFSVLALPAPACSKSSNVLLTGRGAPKLAGGHIAADLG